VVAAVIVKVSLHGDAHRYRRGRADPFDQALPDGATVQQLVEALEIDPAMPLTFGVNGEMAARERSLHEGDSVMILTPMEGGS
jgi:sulfur carrier protein ThiS